MIGCQEKCSPSGIKLISPVDSFFGFLSIHRHDHNDAGRLHRSELEPGEPGPGLVAVKPRHGRTYRLMLNRNRPPRHRQNFLSKDVMLKRRLRR